MPPLTVTVDQLGGLGDTDLGWSDWLTVDQPRIDGFASATEDQQWIHVDPVRAAEGPFGVTIAHGYLTLSLVPRLLDDLLTISDQARGTNYGIERARFTSPVKVGSQVRMHGRLVRVQPRADGGLQFAVAAQVQVQGQERPALVAEVLFLTYAT